MSTEPALTVAQPRASALALMASRFSVEPAKLLETLKGTVFKNATNEQLMALVVVSNEYGLNPFCRQIYAFPDKGGGIVPVISIDGWLHMMQEHAQFDGVEFEEHHDKEGKLVSTTATIHRKDRKVPTRVTEHLAECHRNTDPWKTSPHRMLRHRAVIQCIRVAFGLSGADPDEMERVRERETAGRVLGPSFNQSQPEAPQAEPAPSAAVVETPPVESPTSTEGSFALDGSPPSHIDILRDLMEEHNVDMPALRGVIAKAKLAHGSKVNKLSEMDPALLKTLIENWDDVLSHLGREAA